MKTEKFIQLLSNNRKLIAGPCKKQFFLSFYLFYYIHTPVSPLSQANQSDGNRVAREVEFDHHLTTPSSQPVPCIVFYVPTFFYTHHKQRRKLCTPHNFRRCIIVFSCSSQFSDPEGRWFESSRAHQEQGPAANAAGPCSFSKGLPVRGVHVRPVATVNLNHFHICQTSSVHRRCSCLEISAILFGKRFVKRGAQRKQFGW